jgi:predicted nuclease of predicted toxin-antitoxin system
LKFLIDAQLPPSLAAWLRSKGHDADHVMSVSGLDAPDSVIWDLAVAGDYVIVTKDRDFVEWARSRSPKARILWLRLGNMRRDVFQARMDLVWPELADALASDVTVIEVGR